MCEIDRELVLRGAALFATYAAERQPPKIDPFVAGLIEKALRAKIPAPAPAPAPPVVGVKPGRRQGEVLEYLQRHPAGVKSSDVAKALGIKNGNVSYYVNSLVAHGFAIRDPDGKYFVSAASPAAKPMAARKEKPKKERKAYGPRGALGQERFDRLLQVMRAAPDHVFGPVELAKAANLPSPNTSGSTHGLLHRLIKRGDIVKAGPGQYQIAKTPA